MNENFTLETIYRVYNDDDGSYAEISEDPDGLGLIVVKHVDPLNKGLPDIELPSMPISKAKLLVEAIYKLCDILEDNEIQNIHE